MDCCLCGKVALRVVKGRGYCGDHTQDAFEAQRALMRVRDARNGARAAGYQAHLVRIDSARYLGRGRRAAVVHRLYPRMPRVA